MAAFARSWRRTLPLSGKPDIEPTSRMTESDPIRTSAIHVVGSIGTICREDLDNRALRQLCRFTFANSGSQHALHAL